ncbi:MAG: ATP-binding cassette domain-containing protein [Candidatus Accumulibacter sp.]|jgi:NitT/TauT family transport system ATP-binding protein|nr:ATP-binding cassette domain-containing protein [Accumulibacter sp.]
MLELAGVTKNYAGRMVVDSASLALKAGEIVCLSGPSGVGKSTLLEMAAGLVLPDQGRIRRRSPPALMFQDDALLPWLTAEANIGYILPARMPRLEAARRAAAWLERFGLEGGQYPPAMSGGMRRRLSLARTFASGRTLLILDEPFAFLDDAWQTTVAEEMAARAAAGAGVLLASHTIAPFSLPCFAQKPCRIVSVMETPLVIGRD